ncbi:MAG: WD40/YVTN/BNR-like repeat-containing protein, partial [Blastopirellula sp. JB062]
IVLMHRRIPGQNRNGAGLPDPTNSYGDVLRSEDGGKTWSEPYDLRDCMTPENRERGGLVPLSHRAKFDPDNRSPLGFKVHLHSIGTTRDGAIIAVNNHGVFRSDDAGKSWKHFPEALREDTFGHEIVNIGPRVIDDPELGLLVFGNWFGEVDRYHALRKSLVVLNSQDGGATWKANAMPVGFPQYEPAAISFDGEYRLVTRDQTKVLAHKQLTWKPGGKPQVIDTNLRDPRLVDTVDLSLNPVTKRLEIIRSERHHMELWIWSIDPRDWDQGEWTRECRLLKTSGKFYADTDGFHPAGAVIDQKQGVQHIFVYSGHPNGPAGVFRITRTLDTPQLKAALSGAK